jgi:cytochrome c biogenesis protein ResB
MRREREYEPDPELPPGITREGLKPVFRCRLTDGKDKVDFWLPQNGQVMQHLGDRVFRIEYIPKTTVLDFELKLLRAEQTTDKGTQSAATYTSWVQLTDKKKGIVEKDCMITMNQPLEHGSYKIYQSTYGSITQTMGITVPGSGRPVSYSGFTVGRDPGLPLKYLGSIMLALGIATMFYMRAYFFKPRVRHPVEPATPPAAGGADTD